MAARTLSTTVVLTNPATGDPEVLLADSDLPEWADGLVGEHALNDEKKPARATKAAAADEN